MGVNAPWANRPERQQFFGGDVLEIDGERCRIEAVHAPGEALFAGDGWHYTARPLEGAEPHAFRVSQRYLTDLDYAAACRKWRARELAQTGGAS